MPEPSGRQPPGRRTVSGTFASASQLCKKLAPSTEMIAEPFIASKNGKSHRQKEIQHSQPRKQYIEKSKGKIQNRPQPKIIIPMLIFTLHALPSVPESGSHLPDRFPYISRIPHIAPDSPAHNSPQRSGLPTWDRLPCRRRKIHSGLPLLLHNVLTTQKTPSFPDNYIRKRRCSM